MLRRKLKLWLTCSTLVLGLLGFTSPLLAQEQQEKSDTKQEQKETGEEKAEQKTGSEQKSDTEQESKQETTGDDAKATQDAETEAQGDDKPADLPALKKQWAELNAQMDAKKKAFDESEVPSETATIRDEYFALIEQANSLIEQIRATALAELASGNQDQEIIETLIGIMINDAVFERDAAVLEAGHALIDAGVDPKFFAAAQKASRLPQTGQEIFQELEIRQTEAAADDLPRVKIVTNKGDIVLELFENEAPQTIGNFISLIEDGYYDGIKFHRVLEGFMAQTGDPKTKDDSIRNEWGTGGPGYNIYCECYKSDARRHFTGSLSMAKQAPRDTGGSQFFITFARTSHLDGRHTVFGRVLEGMDVVNSLQRINPDAPTGVEPDVIQSIEVLRKRDHEYTPTKVN